MAHVISSGSGTPQIHARSAYTPSVTLLRLRGGSGGFSNNGNEHGNYYITEFRLQGFGLEGQGDLVRRLVTHITHIVTLVIPIINMLTKSP